MAQTHHADQRDSVTESKFYLPAGVSPSVDSGWFERVWATLFDHRV